MRAVPFLLCKAPPNNALQPTSHSLRSRAAAERGRFGIKKEVARCTPN